MLLWILLISRQVIRFVCDWEYVDDNMSSQESCRWRGKGRYALVLYLILCPFHLLKSVFIDGTMMAVSVRLSDSVFMFYLYIRFHRRFHVVNLLLSNRKRCSSLCFYFPQRVFVFLLLRPGTLLRCIDIYVKRNGLGNILINDWIDLCFNNAATNTYVHTYTQE